MQTATLTYLRRAAIVTLFFLGLSAAFQARGLSTDGLLSRTSFFGGSLLQQPGRSGWIRSGRALDFGTLDYVRYIAPNAAFIQRELQSGHLPLWNPYIGTGVPVAEAMTPGFLHPYTLLLFLLPFEYALTMLAVLRLVPAGLGAFLFARVLGCGFPAGILAGALFMLSSFHLGFRFHTLPNVSSLLPFLLVVSELRLRGRSTRRLGASWSLVGTLMLLGGHAQTSVHCLGAAWAYHLLRAATSGPVHGRGREIGSGFLFLTICTALSVLGASVAVWGHTEILLAANALPYRSALPSPRLPPMHLLSFLMPANFRQVLYPAYFGVITLVLAARGLVSRGAFPAWPWVVLGGGALLGAYGGWPVAPVLQNLPILRAADHTRLIFVVHLALALLAARSLGAPQDAPVIRRVTMAVSGLLAVGLAVLWAAGLCPGPRGWYGFPIILAAPVVFLGIGVVLLSGPSRQFAGRAWPWLVVVAVLADLYAAHGPRPRGEPTAFPLALSVQRFVQGPPEAGRMFVTGNLLAPNVNMIYGLPAVAVYEPAIGRRMTHLLRAAGLQSIYYYGVFAPPEPREESLRVLSLLNVRHILTQRPIENPTLAGRLEELTRDPITIYRNPDALPRVFVVERAILAHSPERALNLLQDPGVDLKSVVILEEPIFPQPASPSGNARSASRARIVDYRPGAVRITASTPHGGYLVLSETYSAGWQATVDGQPSPVLCGDYALIAVWLPPGEHEVGLRYWPRPLIIGALISASTIVVLFGAGLVPSSSTA